MNRLQKKCFIASAACHGLLLAILFFGAALMPQPEESNFKPISIYSPDQVSDLLTSGGGPAATPTPLAPPNKPAPALPEAKPLSKPLEPAPLKPTPEPIRQLSHPAPHPRQPVIEPKPRPEKSKPVEDRNDLTAMPAHPKKPALDPNEFREVKRGAVKPSPAQSSESAEESAAREARRKAARQFAQAYRSISQNLSSSTLIQMTPGGGSSGEFSVNYRDLIASKYYNAWSPPVELDENTPAVLARVTISRDGSVKSAHITKRSGNAAMDRSIQNVLDTVTYIEPFPAGSDEAERTVTIQFNLQAKRQTG